MISKPKEYIDILLNDLVKHVQMATRNYFEERFRGEFHANDSHNRLEESMKRVDEIKSEIFYVISLVGKEND